MRHVAQRESAARPRWHDDDVVLRGACSHRVEVAHIVERCRIEKTLYVSAESFERLTVDSHVALAAIDGETSDPLFLRRPADHYAVLLRLDSE